MSSFVTTKELKSYLAELIRRCRDDPEFKKDPQVKADLAYLSRLFKMDKDAAKAAKVFRMYKSKLAEYSKGKLTPTQARSKAIKYVADQSEITERQVRRILKDSPYL
jgi:hypothetical protein